MCVIFLALNVLWNVLSYHIDFNLSSSLLFGWRPANKFEFVCSMWLFWSINMISLLNRIKMLFPIPISINVSIYVCVYRNDCTRNKPFHFLTQVHISLDLLPRYEISYESELLFIYEIFCLPKYLKLSFKCNLEILFRLFEVLYVWACGGNLL